VSLFRKQEPLHVKLAREGGIDLDGAQSGPVPWDASGIHGLQRPREWDAVTAVDVPELAGDRLEFVALSSEKLVRVEGVGDPGPLAAALGRELSPPYRAEAVRRGGTLWAVAGRRIEIADLPGVVGEEIELAVHGEERTLRVDGDWVEGSIPALERPDHVVRARRIAGESWEVESAAL